MTTSTTDIQVARAQRVAVTEDTLIVDLADGRTISIPIVWYPRLLHGMPEERNNWRLISKGEGAHKSSGGSYGAQRVKSGQWHLAINVLL